MAKIESKKTSGSTVRCVVTVKTVLQRLRRRLLPKGITIIRSRLQIVRGKKSYPEAVGQFFVVQGASEIIEHHVDLDAFARRHGVVKPWEAIEEHRLPAAKSDDAGRTQKRA